MFKLTLVLSLLMYTASVASGSFMPRILPKADITKFIAKGCSVRSCQP